MKILITGGAGFIASHVADAYVAAGHEVVIVDNLSTGNVDFIPRAARFIQADITDKMTIQQIIKAEAPEIINHHAAHIQVGNSVKDPQFDAENNIIALLNIMEAAKDIPIKKIIMASTGGAMYGDKEVPFNETMKEEPVSPYGVSKRSGELYLNYYYQQYQIPFVALRYANVYGPRQNPHGESGVVAIFAEMLMQNKTPVINGEGTNTRDYVFVKDVAQANLLALDTQHVGALNIGTSTETSTNEVFDKIVAALGKNVEKNHGAARPGEQLRSVLSYKKAEEILGWKPTVFFDEGVKLVAQWYQENM
ncbi:MAG: GDP-mannose 4,6-dehydratase [bacterium]|nr:GDP-mannose 4,6-dehydratase [bacterium]